MIGTCLYIEEGEANEPVDGGDQGCTCEGEAEEQQCLDQDRQSQPQARTPHRQHRTGP